MVESWLHVQLIFPSLEFCLRIKKFISYYFNSKGKVRPGEHFWDVLKAITSFFVFFSCNGCSTHIHVILICDVTYNMVPPVSGAVSLPLQPVALEERPTNLRVYSGKIELWLLPYCQKIGWIMHTRYMHIIVYVWGIVL